MAVFVRASSILISATVLVAASAHADRLELGDGTIHEGRYAGGSDGVVSSQVDGGELPALSVAELRALDFDLPRPPFSCLRERR